MRSVIDVVSIIAIVRVYPLGKNFKRRGNEREIEGDALQVLYYFRFSRHCRPFFAVYCRSIPRYQPIDHF